VEGYQAGYYEGKVLVRCGSAAECFCVEIIVDGESFVLRALLLCEVLDLWDGD
jgi:hypothetical protein